MVFKLGSIPVRVQGWFIMMAVLLGANESNPARLAIWVGIVVVSVVIHELGHAMIGKAFGLIPSIELHGMGGTTSFQQPDVPGQAPRGDLGTARNVAISLAGPFAGFLFALVVIVAQLAGFRPTNPIALYALSLLFAVNIGWGIFNLLPMLPLDGGNVLRYVLVAISRKNGDKVARIVSIVVAAGIALYAIRNQQWWILYLGVLFAFRNVQSLRQAGQLRVDQTLAEAVEKSYPALEQQRWTEAIAVLRPALVPEASNELRQVALQLFIGALIRDGGATEAIAVIERERRLVSAEDLARYEHALRELGREADADRIARLGDAPPALGEFRA